MKVYKYLEFEYLTYHCKLQLSFFCGGATSKHFHHYIQPTLNEINVKIKRANDILKTEADEYLTAKSVTDIEKECVWFSVKDVFVSSATVNTRCSSAFISPVDKILQDKFVTHQFHFIAN